MWRTIAFAFPSAFAVEMPAVPRDEILFMLRRFACVSGCSTPLPPGWIENRVGPIGKAVIATRLAEHDRIRQSPEPSIATKGRDAVAPELNSASLEVDPLELLPASSQRFRPCWWEAMRLQAPGSDRPRRRISAAPAIGIPDLVDELPDLGWGVSVEDAGGEGGLRTKGSRRAREQQGEQDNGP